MQLRVGINNVQKRRKTSVSLRANLVGASLTGLVVGYVLWMESVSSYEPIYRFKDYAAKAGIAIASYIAATYLVHLVFLRRLAVRNLRWALIALTGSILIVGYAL